MNSHFVYVHKFKDTGEIFYVGKGKGRRALEFAAGRSPAWQEVAFKHGVTVEYHRTCLSNWEAKIAEIVLIDKLLAEDHQLVNKVVVARSVDISDKGREYDGQLLYKFKNVLVPTIVCASVEWLSRMQGACPAELFDVIHGRSPVTSDGWASNE